MRNYFFLLKVMDSFTDLEAWKKGMHLLKEVYALTENFPSKEQYGMVSQIRRASSSILANLAEGFSRATAADKAHKYTISRGECSETKAFLFMAVELGFLTTDKAEKAINLCDETGKILNGLIRSYTLSS